MSKALTYSSSFTKRKFRLIEVPNVELLKGIESGEKLEIKGGDNEDVVLCSKKSTYSLKKVENSNTQYLTPLNSDSIEGDVKAFYELNLTKPRLNQITDALQHALYNGENSASIDSSKLITKKELFSNTQASSEEINASLSQLGVIEIDGFMRIVSPKTLREVIRCILDTITENSWPMCSISERLCLHHNPTLDARLVQLALEHLGTVDLPCDTEGGPIWILDYERVAKACAHDLFIKHLAHSSPDKVSIHIQHLLIV